MQQAPINTSLALIVDPMFPVEWQRGWEQTRNRGSYRAPIVSRSAPEALKYLSNGDLQFGSIYLNAILTAPGVLQLIRISHKHHPGTPIFILYDHSAGSSCPFSSQELNRLAIQGAIELRGEDAFFKQLCAPMIDLEKEGTTITASAESAMNDTTSQEFVPIPIQRFNFSSKIFFDLFIRMDGEKFLKMHGAGSSITEEGLRNYLKNGVTHLYFQRASYLRCLEYCDLLERTLLTSSGLSSSVKISTILNRGFSKLEILRDRPKADETLIEEIIEFVNDVRRLLNQIKLDTAEDIQTLVQNAAVFEHSIGTTAIALLLAKTMNLEDEQSAEALGIASLLHDIGLSRMPPAVQSEDLSRMIGSQRELYHQHPTLGAQLLRDSGVVPPVAIQAVAQHHERRNGSGFPNQLVGQQIHRLSEIVAFSDEFVRLIQLRPGAPLKDVIQEMEARSFESFSLQMMEGFQKAFGPLRK